LHLDDRKQTPMRLIRRLLLAAVLAAAAAWGLPHIGHHEGAGAAMGRPAGPATAGLVRVHDPGQVTGTLTGPCHTRDHGKLPDRRCTPGSVDPAVTQANLSRTICVPEHLGSGRVIYVLSASWAAGRPPEGQTEAFKYGQAEPAYGQHHVSGELDHLVAREIGGSNAAANLWVENYRGFLNADDKDRLEDYLHDAVCSGRMLLQTAQETIAADWVKAYCAARLGECPAGLQ
jgi:hypothetical protein